MSKVSTSGAFGSDLGCDTSGVGSQVSGQIRGRGRRPSRGLEEGDLGSVSKSEADTESDISTSDPFLAKGAFLLTPSYELTVEKAGSICEKMNFKSSFSLTKTATGILFKFENPEDYQGMFKKAFHKVLGARFYKKIAIPCRPRKTFTIFVYDIPEEIPEDDVRHALFKFHSVVELTRLPRSISDLNKSTSNLYKTDSSSISKTEKTSMIGQNPFESTTIPIAFPPIIRITLASLEETNTLLENGLDFYGATFFPTDVPPSSGVRSTEEDLTRTNLCRRFTEHPFYGFRIQDALPVFDSSGFKKVSPPAIKTIKPPSSAREREAGKK